MRNEQHYRELLAQNVGDDFGFPLAADMVYAARYGACDPGQRGTDEWKTIDDRLRSDYGETLSYAQISAEMERANRSATNSISGRIGGSQTSPAKKKSSRENGKLGGRPKKTTQ